MRIEEKSKRGQMNLCSITATHPMGISNNPYSAKGETPFKMTYKTKAVIHVEIGEPTFRIVNLRKKKKNMSKREENLPVSSGRKVITRDAVERRERELRVYAERER